MIHRKYLSILTESLNYQSINSFFKMAKVVEPSENFEGVYQTFDEKMLSSRSGSSKLGVMFVVYLVAASIIWFL